MDERQTVLHDEKNINEACNNSVQTIQQQTLDPKCVTAKLVIGILSLVLFVIIALQSCAVGLGNALLSNGDSSGATGLVVAFNFLITGVIAVAARKAIKLTPWIISAALLWFSYFIGKMNQENFADLAVWGFISFAFGVFYLLSSVKTKRGFIISSIVSTIYLIIALI